MNLVALIKPKKELKEEALILKKKLKESLEIKLILII